MSRRPSQPPAPTPGALARTDQDAAMLRDLAATARRHHTLAGCPTPTTCPGEAVEALIELRTDPGGAYRLLLLAVAELGASGWGQPAETFVDPRPGHPRGRAARDG